VIKLSKRSFFEKGIWLVCSKIFNGLDLIILFLFVPFPVDKILTISISKNANNVYNNLKKIGYTLDNQICFITAC